MLDVDRGDHGDAGIEQFLDVLPALLVLTARCVGVGEFVDQNHVRVPLEDALYVEFREVFAAIMDVAGRDYLDTVKQRSSSPTPVSFEYRGHQVGAALQAPVC